jgi:phage FluMu protein Com
LKVAVPSCDYPVRAILGILARFWRVLNASADLNMHDVRCNSCNALLFRAGPESRADVEMVCRKCKRLAKITLPLKRWSAPDVRLELVARTSVTAG